MKWIMFVPWLVCLLQSCARCDNSLNYPSLHSLSSSVFNSWSISNRSPVVRSIMVLRFIMPDIKVSSSADRWMVEFVFWDTIELERLRIHVDCLNVGFGGGVTASGYTLGTLVLPFEWICTLGTIVGSFDLTITLWMSVGIRGLVGGSCRSQLLKMSLSLSTFFLDVVPSVGSILFFIDNWSVVHRSSMVL